MNRATRIVSSAYPVGEVRAGHGGGISQGIVTPDKFSPVARDGTVRCVDGKESDTFGELRVVRIACEECAADRIDFRDHAHLRFFPQLSENPLDVAGSGKGSGRPRFIFYLQHGILDAVFQSHVNPEFGTDTVFDVFENTVAESVRQT